MTTLNLDDAVQKIISHIAETGKPRAKVIRSLWKELALPPATVKRMAQQYLLAAQYDYNFASGLMEELDSEYSLVGRGLDHELQKFQLTNPDLRLEPAQVQQAVATMFPLFGKPGCTQRDGEPGQRFAWRAKTQEQALHMCTVLSQLGFKCLYHKGRGLYMEVRIYGPWTERRMVNQVEKKLDGVA